MNQPLIDDVATALSPGNYTNVKYWALRRSQEKLVITTGAVPWKMIFFMEAFICGLGSAILFFFVKMSQRSHEAIDLTIFIPVSFIFGLVALGCFVLPFWQARSEQSKGDILIYDLNRKVLNLPREQLTLQKSQIVEFRVLQENRPTRRRGGDFEVAINTSPTELRLIYKNPNEKATTLLQTGGNSFQDVVKALKESNIAKIVLYNQQPGTEKWNVREI
jgi:hypothetical protein